MHALLVAAYLWTEIVIPNAPIGTAFGPNDRGEVAVASFDGTVTGIWRRGNFTPLPAPPADITVTALGINDAGTIVGSAFTADGHAQGFILVRGQYTVFSRPGWDNTNPRAISDSGLVTGYSQQDVGGPTAGFVFDPATGIFTDVTPKGSTFTIVQGINAAGRIAGSGSERTIGTYAFVWQQAASKSGKLAPFLDRIVIGDSSSRARGINDEGFVAGFAGPGAHSLGLVGNPVRGFQFVTPPGGEVATSNTVCEGINNARQIACSVTDADGNSRAFLGTPGDDGGDE